jgi:hypothetical protein
MTRKADVVREYLRSIGARGGKAGTGAAKRRGGSAYYRKLASKRRQRGK